MLFAVCFDQGKRSFRHDNNGFIKKKKVLWRLVTYSKTKKYQELWQTEFPDPPVQKRLSFGSFGFCRELVMSIELRDTP